jgi:DNA ligase 1
MYPENWVSLSSANFIRGSSQYPPMEYARLVDHYLRLEETASRLEMTDILVDLIDSVPEELLGRIMYLTLGKLGPDYLGLEFGIAEKLVIRSLAFTTGFDEHKVLELWQRTGDPGNATEELLSQKRQRSLFATPLTVERVFETFTKLAESGGKGTQDTRIKYLAELLHDAEPSSGKYIVRTVVGKLRLGVADMTIIDALAVHHLTREKEHATEVDGIGGEEIPDDRSDEGHQPDQNEESDQKKMEGKGGNQDDLDENEQLEEDDIWDAVDGDPVDEDMVAEDAKIEPLFTIAEKKAVRGEIEAAYNIHPDIGTLAERIVKDGLQGIEEVRIEIGVPIRVMLAERLSTPEDILEKLDGEAAFEHKYDGIRIQAHVGHQRIVLFTRHQEDVTSQFPDVVEALKEIRGKREMIIEGECVPVDVETGAMLPFQMVSRRRGRKYDLEGAVKEFPVVLFLFDILYLDGENLIRRDFPERRGVLESTINVTEKVRLSTLKVLSDPVEVESFFIASLDAGTEGLVAKSVGEDSFYRAGARGWQWIKFKKDYRSELVDTLDLVVVGGFHGRGRRAGTFGALLMAAYDKENDRFETVCKLGSGFDDAFLETMNSMFVPLEKKPGRVRAEMKADVWFEPKHVFEVLAAEITLSPIHTCAWGVLKEKAGIAVRFPRYTGIIRVDKGPEDATTSEEFVEMYGLQGKKST